MKSITAPIVKKEIVARGTIAVSFDVGAEFSFQAGQYATITLPHLSECPIKEQFRDFSITSSPEEIPIITVTYRDSTSLYKKTLSGMQTGDNVLVEGPKGVFMLPAEDTQLIFIAGGVGITPFISMLRHLKQSPGTSKPILFYYNRSRDSAAYLSELEGYQDVIILHAVFGPITKESIVVGNDDLSNALWYVAGPQSMVKGTREILSTISVGDEHIRTEEFTGYE